MRDSIVVARTMTTSESPRITLNFGNLPLVEAAVRATLAAPAVLSFPVISKTHEPLREEFPEVNDPPEIERAPGIQPGPIEISPSIRLGVVYAGNRDGLQIGIHAQHVVVRWLRQATKDGPQYPRFPILRDTLWRAADAYRLAIDAQDNPIVVNISYVNFIAMSPESSVLETYLSQAYQLEAMKDVRNVHKMEVSWRREDSVDLRFAIEQASADIDGERVGGYKFTTVCGKIIDKEDNARTELDSIHAMSQRFFHDLISERAKREWQLEVVDEN